MIFASGFIVVSFIAAIFRPFIGLLGLLTIVLIRFQERIPEVAILRPFTLVFFGLCLGIYLNRKQLPRHKWIQDRLLILIFILSTLGMTLVAPNALLHESWLFINAIGFFFFATRLIQTPKQFIIVFLVISTCVGFMAAEATNSALLLGMESPHIDIRNGRWQGLGYYANPNEFGQLLIMCIPLLLAIIQLRINMFLSIAALALIGFLIFVVFKTNSRTVMVVLGMMFMMYAVLRSTGRIGKKLVVLAIVGAILLAGVSFLPGNVQDRLTSIQSASQDASFQGRTRSWGYGFDMLTWYPVTGVGKGQWIQYHGLMPHNSYIQMMAENGPIVILLFLALIIFCLREFLPFFRIKKKEKDVVLKAQDNINIRKTSTTMQPLRVDKTSKTIAIAIVVLLCGWLMYIFLGNQAYSVWTYFYLGLAAATKNLVYKTGEPESDEEEANG